MPRKAARSPRRRRADIVELTIFQKFELLHGSGIFGDEMDAETYAAAWREHREQLLADWIAEHPGTRPHAWWVVEGVPRYGERRLTEFGRRTIPGHRDGWLTRGIINHTTIPPMQEPEDEYLRRHGLLTPAEVALLSHDFSTNPQDQSQ